MISNKTNWLLIFLLAYVDGPLAFADKPQPPNVVFLLADDLGWTGLRCFGSDFYETPNLDGLASSGIKLTNAYAACTVCSPTRASIMTGMYPARLRCTDFIAGQNRPKAKLSIPNWTKQLEAKHFTIAEAFHSAGYKTAHVGKWHLSAKGRDAQETDPVSQGFDVSIQKPAGSKGYSVPARVLAKLPESYAPSTIRSAKGSAYLTDWLTDQACAYLEEQSETPEPFFLYFAYHTPHTPIQGRPDLVEYFRGKVDETLTHNDPAYAAMVASLDQSVGRILQTLEARGLKENTIVVFTSDNGGLTQRYGVHDNFTENLPLRRGKGSAFEGGVRVPAIVRWPSQLQAGIVVDTPIMTIDYYPTLLSACGIAGNAKHNANVDGLDLLPVLKGDRETLDRSLFWHYPHYHAGGDGPYSAVRNGNYRLIEFHEDDSLHLYDLTKDLAEQTNLAQSMPKKTAHLKKELYDWRGRIQAQMPTPNPNYDPNASPRPRRVPK